MVFCCQTWLIAWKLGEVLINIKFRQVFAKLHITEQVIPGTDTGIPPATPLIGTQAQLGKSVSKANSPAGPVGCFHSTYLTIAPV